jgi:DNA polymerase-1
VHDELVFEGPAREMDALASLVKEGMRSALELEVPIVVDVGIGDNWLEAH